jgi:hypothetical protein
MSCVIRLTATTGRHRFMLPNGRFTDDVAEAKHFESEAEARECADIMQVINLGTPFDVVAKEDL